MGNKYFYLTIIALFISIVITFGGFDKPYLIFGNYMLIYHIPFEMLSLFFFGLYLKKILGMENIMNFFKIVLISLMTISLISFLLWNVICITMITIIFIPFVMGWFIKV